MRKVYFDANVINRAKEFWTAGEFEALLKAQGDVPSIGVHLIYELARGSLHVEKVERIRSLFGFLNELEDPHYVPPTKDLIKNEILKAQTGAIVLSVMSKENQRRMKEVIWRMAEGLTDVAKQFIREREDRIKGEAPQISQEVIHWVDEFQRANPEYGRIPGTFRVFRESLTIEDFLSILRIGTRGMGLEVSELDMRRILSNPNDYPVFNTWFNSVLYLNWIPIRHRVAPSPARFDDFRHLIDCCASDLFVSDDDELIKRFPDINPYREYLSWDTFKAILEGNNSI